MGGVTHVRAALPSPHLIDNERSYHVSRALGALGALGGGGDGTSSGERNALTRRRIGRKEKQKEGCLSVRSQKNH